MVALPGHLSHSQVYVPEWSKKPQIQNQLPFRVQYSKFPGQKQVTALDFSLRYPFVMGLFGGESVENGLEGHVH